MANKLTLEALEVLDAIDRKGSFAAAAAALYKVPSAVTYTMHKLEDDLGVILFRKEGRRSILTPAGNILLEQGRELLEAADRLVETTREIDSGWESTINIAIDTIFDIEIIYPVLKKFNQLKSDIEINIHEEVLAGTWESIIDGRTDIVIGGIDRASNTQGLKFTEIAKVEWCFAVAPDHPLTKLKIPITEDDIQCYRGVVVRDSSRNLPTLSRRLIDKQTVLSVSTMQQKIDCQVAGLGVGYLPLNRIEEQLTAKQLTILPIPIEDPVIPLQLVWRSSNKGKAMRWFVEELKQYFTK